MLLRMFVVIFTTLYTLLLGATFTGSQAAVLRLFSVIALGLGLVWWGWQHWRRGWHWQRTLLDPVLPLWAVVFIISLLANPHNARSSLLAMWYMGVYTVLWYGLHDLIANRSLSLRLLQDAVLITGLAAVVIGYSESFSTAESTGRAILSYRPSSTLSNPNMFAPLVMVVIILLVAQLLAVRQWLVRIALGGALLLSAGMFYLTRSRGSWVGLGLAIVVAALWHWGPGIWRWWRERPQGQRIGLAATAGAAGITGCVVLLMLFTSGRGDNGRIELYSAAINIFLDHPIAGSGLFTYLMEQAKFTSFPPAPAHIQAHSLPLNILAENGLIGFAALLFTIGWTVRWVWQHRTSLSRYSVIGCVILVGLAGAHLFDIPAINRSIALLFILAFLFIADPHPPTATTRITRQQSVLRGLVLALLSLILISSGLWNSITNYQFNQLMRPLFEKQDYATIAQTMQPYVDPGINITDLYADQGYLWGVASLTAPTLTQNAIAAYQQSVHIAPYYAPYQVNLAALYWQDGQQAQALETMQAAAKLAYASWVVQYNLGLYAEAMGDTETAQHAYAEALRLEPDVLLLDTWDDSPLRAALRSDTVTLSAITQISQQIVAGDAAAALSLWETHRPTAPEAYVLRSLIALMQDDLTTAEASYQQARRTAADRLWLDFNALMLARHTQDDTSAAEHQQQITEALTVWYTPQDINGYKVTQAKALRNDLLPQVFYPYQDLRLMYLLQHTPES